jgi:hypothetical protein
MDMGIGTGTKMTAEHRRGGLTHSTWATILGKLLLLFPGAYVISLIGILPLLLGLLLHSLSLTLIVIVVHTIALFTIPVYLFLWRVLTYGGRLLYTMALHRFLFHLSQSRGFKTVYADLARFPSVDAFYQAKSRSIRRRMTRNIPDTIAKMGVEVHHCSSNRISLKHLKIQYAHSRKYTSRALGLYMMVLGFFSLVGHVTEYHLHGALVGQGIGFLRGETYTIYQYGACDEAARIGLWFYNILEHLRHAIVMEATFVNGTMDIHHPEAKRRAGLITTDAEDLVSRLYGGSLLAIPYEGLKTRIMESSV